MAYAAIIAFLRDLEINGQFLVDPNNEVMAAITANLASWPHRYRTHVKEVLSRLRTRRRIVKTTIGYIPAVSCGTFACRHSVGIAASITPDAAIVPEQCVDCVSEILKPVPVTTWAGYLTSTLPASMHEKRGFILPYGEWTTAAVEGLVLQPLFRFAKHISIVDRYIGRTMMSSSGQPPRLGNGYRAGVEWILETFVTAAIVDSHDLTAEIWCGLHENDVPATAMAVARAELEAWCADISQRLGLPINLRLKRETYRGAIPHARYLITDQISVLVERGYELLLTDTQMRQRGLDPVRDMRRVKDAVITVCPNASTVRTEIARLSDV